MALRYLGIDTRTDWLPGVPARDLTDEDIAELGLDEAELVGRLYEKVDAPVAPVADEGDD